MAPAYPSYDDVPETVLLARICTGDQVAERRFYDAHVAMVYRMARRMTGDAELAEDLTQETFLRAFAKADQYRGDGSARGWLQRIARSVILNGLVRRRVHRLREPQWDEETLPMRPAEALVVEPLTFELRERLELALAQIPRKHRLAVLLYHVEGHTHKDVARMLGITVESSKVLMCRARARLRTLLADYAHEWLA